MGGRGGGGRDVRGKGWAERDGKKRRREGRWGEGEEEEGGRKREEGKVERRTWSTRERGKNEKTKGIE